MVDLMFILGALSSISCEYIGILVTVKANYRTAIGCKKSLREGFILGFRSGSILAFYSVALGLLILLLITTIYFQYLLPVNPQYNDYLKLFELVAGYAFGGSIVGFIRHISRRMYMNAANIGIDYIKEDSNETSLNEVVITLKNAGGVEIDLFESFIASICAALFVSGTFSELANNQGILLFPLLITGSGIIASLFTMFFATHIVAIVESSDLRRAIKYQKIIVAVLGTTILYAITIIGLPYQLTNTIIIINFHSFLCIAIGLWSSFIFKYLKTTSSFFNTIPAFFIALVIGICYYLAGGYGIVLGSVSFHCTICIDLSISGYGSICESAYSLSIGEDIRKTVYELHSSVSEESRLGSGAFTALALFFAFVIEHELEFIDLLSFLQVCGFLIGILFAWLYSALVTQYSHEVSNTMIKELRSELIKRQRTLLSIAYEEYFDIGKCMRTVSHISFKHVLVIVCIVVVTPLLCGFIFGNRGLAVILAGGLIGNIVINNTISHIFIKTSAIAVLVFSSLF